MLPEFLQWLQTPAGIIIVTLWTLPWKGIALWKASRNSHRNWFVALLIINSFALLEILYIYKFSEPLRKRKKK